MKVYLNKREEQVMQALWKLKKAFVKDIIAELPPPKAPYNTISSVVRKLEDRGFVDHEAFGKTHRYFPVLQKKQYRQQALQQFITNYFGGSVEQVVSFFLKEEDVSVDELEGLLDKIKKQEE